MLQKNTSQDEELKVVALEQTTYLNETYTSMALLISLLEKKNLLLKHIMKCDTQMSHEKANSREFKEKLAWMVNF